LHLKRGTYLAPIRLKVETSFKRENGAFLSLDYTLTGKEKALKFKLIWLKKDEIWADQFRELNAYNIRNY
jgi:hypothetical protein